MKVLHDIWREAWQPPDRRPAWEWCEDHIEAIPYSPNPGRFRSENSPWIREVMEAESEYRRRGYPIIDVTTLTIEQTIARFPENLLRRLE